LRNNLFIIFAILALIAYLYLPFFPKSSKQIRNSEIKILFNHIYLDGNSVTIASFWDYEKQVSIKKIIFYSGERKVHQFDLNYIIKSGDNSFRFNTKIDLNVERIDKVKLLSHESKFYQKNKIFTSVANKISNQKEKMIFENKKLKVFHTCPFRDIDKVLSSTQIELVDSCVIISDIKNMALPKLEFKNKTLSLNDKSFIAFMNLEKPLVIKNVKISGGRGRWINNLKFNASLNLYNLKSVRVQNLEVKYSKAEDAINVKESHGELSDITIAHAAGDGIDIDLSTIVLKNITIENAMGDGVDFSMTKGELTDFRSHSIVDKGVSIGESSTIKGERWVFGDNVTMWSGIKDSSELSYKVFDNKEEKRLREKFKVFQKKPLWGNGQVDYVK
tara:strand:+ start:38895 stop:40061 length:1167 start_codon:yes stop_codon:yes gene_type:complete